MQYEYFRNNGFNESDMKAPRLHSTSFEDLSLLQAHFIAPQHFPDQFFDFGANHHGQQQLSEQRVHDQDEFNFASVFTTVTPSSQHNYYEICHQQQQQQQLQQQQQQQQQHQQQQQQQQQQHQLQMAPPQQISINNNDYHRGIPNYVEPTSIRVNCNPIQMRQQPEEQRVSGKIIKQEAIVEMNQQHPKCGETTICFTESSSSSHSSMDEPQKGIQMIGNATSSQKEVPMKSSSQQSQLKNANKFCMSALLNFLMETLPNYRESHHLIKFVMRIKGSGKLRSKVDIFTLSHFRVLFLSLNEWNVSQLSPSDIKMHREVFAEIMFADASSHSNSNSFSKTEMDNINAIKHQLLPLSLHFFEDSASIKLKISQKLWQKTNTALHYIDWVKRVSKGIQKMTSGVYIHRF